MSGTNANEFTHKRKLQERDEFTADVDSLKYGAQQRAALDAWERQKEVRMSSKEREARRKHVGKVEEQLKRFEDGDINARTFLINIAEMSGEMNTDKLWDCPEREPMQPRPRSPPSPRTYWPGKRVAPCSPISLSRSNFPTYRPTSPSYSPTSPSYKPGMGV
jgi:hypothetical protein